MKFASSLLEEALQPLVFAISLVLGVMTGVSAIMTALFKELGAKRLQPRPLKAPQVAKGLFLLLTHFKDQDAVLGDIEECFVTIGKQHNRVFARTWYWSQITQSIVMLNTARILQLSALIALGEKIRSLITKG